MSTTRGEPAPQKTGSTGCRGGVPTPPDCGGQLGHAQLTPRHPDVSRSAVTLSDLIFAVWLKCHPFVFEQPYI